MKVIFDPILGRLRKFDDGGVPPEPTPVLNDFSDDFDPTDFY